MPDAVVFIVLLSHGSSPGVVLQGPRMRDPVGGPVFVGRTLTLQCFVVRADHSLVGRSVG